MLEAKPIMLAKLIMLACFACYARSQAHYMYACQAHYACLLALLALLEAKPIMLACLLCLLPVC
jgi:hypothetical protein